MFRDPAAARSARLHPAGRSAGLPDRDQVRQRAARDRHHRAPGDRPIRGAAARRYPAGSFVVKTAQAFRPHVLDMFEPQDHPNDVAYPGGPPMPPYDSAGWTLAFQMGVKFDRMLDGVRRPVRAGDDRAQPAAGAVRDGDGRRRLSREPSPERRVRGRQPPAARRRGGLLAGRSRRGRRRRGARASMAVPATTCVSERARQGGRGSRGSSSPACRRGRRGRR